MKGNTLGKGRVHINKDGVNKNVKQNDLTKYLNSGWVLGWKINTHDRKWMNNGAQNKYVKPEEIQEYDLWFKKTTNANMMSGQIQKMNPTLTTELQFPDVIGSVFLSGDMKNIVLHFMDTQIVGPASTVEEAIKIYHDIFNID